MVRFLLTSLRSRLQLVLSNEKSIPSPKRLTNSGLASSHWMHRSWQLISTGAAMDWAEIPGPIYLIQGPKPSGREALASWQYPTSQMI